MRQFIIDEQKKCGKSNFTQNEKTISFEFI